MHNNYYKYYYYHNKCLRTNSTSDIMYVGINIKLQIFIASRSTYTDID